MKPDFNFKLISDLNEVRDVTVSYWLHQFSDGTLTQLHFLKHWASWVPKAFSPEKELNSYEPNVNGSVVNNVLINTLERFIFNNNEDFQKLFADVSKVKSICGSIFKTGDPFYNCKDCGTDPTCVLCSSCFKMSEHKNHNYKIGTSSGGGSCDCGDNLSWKSNPHCKIHLQGVHDTSRAVSFPEDLISRTEIVISSVLHYCFEILWLKSSSTLPTVLKLMKEDDNKPAVEDLYCVVLYNDERHSFDQVVSTLCNKLKCNKIDAFSLAAFVDKEGRAILRCSSYSKCCELKRDLDSYATSLTHTPLKVHILDWYVVAHQMYSLELLSWTENFMKQTKEFRDILTSVGLNLRTSSLIPRSELSIVEAVLFHDTFLWKAARLRWYHLFLSVMLVDHNNKLAFARIFTSYYRIIVENFITDDHDHTFSASSLSVQIFTVPAIAHYLISSEDALYIMLNTFDKECTKLRNSSGKFEFPHSHSASPFLRSFCILNDLRYILNTPPEVWTSDLRKNFLHGISALLEIFLAMEEMCAAKRQTGQHLEFEMEWKQEFRLQTKLTPVISHMLNWCSTDQIVALKAYKLTLKKLYNYYGSRLNEETFKSVSLIGHFMNCFDYDILDNPVSIHLPLSRFFAGLYLNIVKFGFHYTSAELSALIKPTPLQLIEPILRTKVMIAQVYAGMWKRNGYSLQHQISYYQGIKCQIEMMDKDIILLQIGASLIKSNEFLLNILFKFHLIDWLNPTYESLPMSPDVVKQFTLLSEEFLLLLITIIGERYHIGIGKVTPEECLRNEIIHRLCIKPCLHSELHSLLPDNDAFKIRIESVIDKVATFKKPNNSQKGVYILKEEFRNKYNVFFYHYNREERSVSEEEQRKQQKTLSGTEFCPPPCLPKLNFQFQAIVCLLHCDIMLHIMQTVLRRSQSSAAVSFSDGQLQKVLFLIGFALEEDKCYCAVKFTTKASKWNLECLLEKLLNCQHVEIHKDFIKWLLKKYATYIKGHEEHGGESLQVSNKIGVSDHQTNQQIANSKLVAERQAAIMAKMFALQQNFIHNNANLFTNLEINEECSNEDLVAHEKNKEASPHTHKTQYFEKKLTCIICQEGQILSQEGSPMLCAAFLQKSTVLPEKSKKLFVIFGFNYGPALHVSTCGHFMHLQCWNNYIKIIQSEENRRPFRARQVTAFDPERNEYLCPLCKRLSNTTLPVLPNFDVKVSQTSFSEWLQNLLEKYPFSCSLNQQESYFKELCEFRVLLDLINEDIRTNETESTISNHPLHSLLSETSVIVSPNSLTNEVSSVLCNETVGELNKTLHIGDDIFAVIESFIFSLNDLKEICISVKESFFLLWHLCVYTVRSFEKYLNLTETPLFGSFNYRQEICFRSLVNLVSTFSALCSDNLIKSKYYQKILFILLKTYGAGWPEVLNCDCFNLFISLVMTSETFLDFRSPQGSLLDNNVLKMILMLNFAQIIVFEDINGAISNEGDVISEDTKCLTEIIKLFKNCRGINTVELWNLLKAYSLPFLRCCAIFYYFLLGVEPSQTLKEVGGDTFENILDYLGISSKCQELLGIPHVKTIFLRWAMHPVVDTIRNEIQNSRNSHQCKLIDLPHDYFELINDASTFICPNTFREDIRSPTMCLICGGLLCGDPYCCQKELNKTLVGSCTYHTHRCGGGNGIFLRLRECQVLLLSSNPSKGCFLPAPYFDEYGEPDQGLLRGDPLYLCQEEYNNLQKLWLSHRIPEEISKAIESFHGFTSTQWNLL